MKKIFWLILWLIPVVAFSQEKATFSFQNKPLSKALFSVEKIYNVRFSYANELVKDKQITLEKKSRTLKETLDAIEIKTAIHFQKASDRYYILKKIAFNLNTPQQLEEILLKNYLTKGISKNKKGYFTIKPLELDILPGLIETDVLESIQQLPGVVSPNETATGLVIRGGTQDQNRILWDGINIYHNGHLFGMISAFNPNIAKNITFHNKGTNPRFGERISSVIAIKTNTKITNKTNASFSLNGINSDFVIETPLLKNKLSLQVSTRRSYADLFQTPTFDRLANKVFQNTKVNNLNKKDNTFIFTDYNAKINYQLNKNNKISFSAIYITNQLDYHTKEDNSQNTINDKLNIKNQGTSLNWHKKWTNRIKQNTDLSFSKYQLNYNLIELENNVQTSNFDKRNVIYDTNITTEIDIESSTKNKLNIGYQYSFKDVGYAFLNAKETELILDSDKKRVGTHALFGNYSYKNHQLFDFEAGVRVNYYKQFRKVKFEPRLVVLRNITNRLKVQITGEIKNQIISQIDETVLSDLSLENKLWHLADDKIFPITNSKHITAGLLYKNKGWSFDLDHYRKNVDGITALSLGFLNPDGKTFRVGNKKIKGFDFYVKKDLNKLKTWLSYSYTDVKSKFTDLNEDKYFTANTSITHAISTSVAYKFKKLQIALGWKWRTGKPYTKSIIKNGKLDFEGINTQRLPNYHRLDFSSTYQFTFSKDKEIKGKIGLSIKNVYNQKNHLSKEYNGFNNINDPVTVQDKYSLGFTPNFLFKIYW